MAISLVQPKERHTGIWCLLVKYLLWQCAMWTTFGKHNYFDLFFEQLVQALWTGRYESFFGTFQRTTYWNLVPTGEVFALVVVCGQLLGNVSTLADFRTVGASTLNRTLRNFLWNISKNNILEFGIYWRSICVGSVLFGQNFVTTISLAVFWIVRASHLLRARWIFLWNIPKNNIMKFGAYLYSIYPGSVLGGHFWGNAIC